MREKGEEEASRKVCFNAFVFVMSDENDCRVMADVANSTFLRFALIFTVIGCITCIPCCLYSLYRILPSTKLHFNSKCIFVIHNSAMLLHCVIRIILHGKDLLNYFGPWHSACEIFPSRSRCELRVYYKYTQFVIEISPFLLTVERFLATFRAHKYENRYKIWGIFLVASHLALAYSLVSIQKQERVGEDIIYYCWMASVGNRYNLNVPIFVILFSQLATIPALLYLLKKNERHRETSLNHCHSLSQRYQIFENLRTLSMFRVVSIVTWIFVAYNATATYAVNAILPIIPMPMQFASVELIHMVPIYYLILAFLILREDKKPQSQFIIKVNNYEPHYFNELQKFFDEAFEKIRKQKNQTFPVTGIQNK